MADSLLSALAQTVLETLGSAVVQEIGLAWGLTDELNNLESIFGTIQLVLHDAELKQRKSEALQNWLTKLKNVAYDVENVLDEIATEGLRRKTNSERGNLYSFFSVAKSVSFRSKMAHKVKNVREKLDSIAKERHQFHLTEGVVENRFGVTLESRQTNSVVNGLMVFGRNEETEMIIEELVDTRHLQDDLSVYAIWGMGGLGKTTLTQLVYNDARIMKLFELRIWVCVSDDFSVERLIKEIIECVDGNVCNVSGSDPLQRLLREKLRRRRFLLVLDDVWNENHNLWDGLKEVLRCGLNGNMLMVTTRIEKVATMMATIAPYNIGNLSEDDSWSLFKQRAFTTDELDENLVTIGKAIAKKCGGVPLAIKALGSLMRLKPHESEWLAIKNSEIWHLRDDENYILPALRLSYDNLLPQMRQCFAYCCIFPKDYIMDENQLIPLWMANGFIIPSQGQTDLHLVGRLIFKELVWRSFLQDGQKNLRGEMKCKMHDLMHDLASSIMRHETYILEEGKVRKFPKMLRHLGLDLMFSRAVSPNESKLKLSNDNSLRSVIVHKDVTKGFLSFVSKQRYLRVLVMQYHGIQKSPNLLYKLVHLRNLTVSCENLKKLPESLSCLHNLQTLKLMSSWNLIELFQRLKLMKNLWFLEMEFFDSLLCTPPGLGDLTCLCRLSVFIVGQDASHQINQLKHLNLGGELSILGLGNVRDLEDAKSANLIMKKNLTCLSLSWKNNINENFSQRCEEILEGLQPHENLEKDCGRCEHLPALGELPSFTNLRLIGMKSLKCLGVEWHGNVERPFPALAILTIRRMPNLVEWNLPESIESFLCLKELEVKACPKLTKLPFLPNLRSLYLYSTSVTLLGSITFLTIEILHIRNLPIRTLPNVLDNPSTLKTLYLYECSELEFVAEGLQNLNSLQNLQIYFCDSITSFPAAILESMSSLTSLSFERCKKLDPLSGPLRRRIVLQRLVIFDLPELKHFQESMQKLSCLKELWINFCPGLRSMPNWIGSLESLRVLWIIGCPHLEKRCKKPNGEDWPLISHIPIVSPGEY